MHKNKTHTRRLCSTQKYEHHHLTSMCRPNWALQNSPRHSPASPTPESEENDNLSNVAKRSGPKSLGGRNHFETVFAEAEEGGRMEVRALCPACMV